MSGREVAARLRRIRPDLPVIFISGLATSLEPRPEDGQACDYLAKPFSVAELVDRVESLRREAARP